MLTRLQRVRKIWGRLYVQLLRRRLFFLCQQMFLVTVIGLGARLLSSDLCSQNKGFPSSRIWRSRLVSLFNTPRKERYLLSVQFRKACRVSKVWFARY